MADIKNRLDKINSYISDDDFLANRSLANEVGFYVFCYEPSDELIVRDYIERLAGEKSDKYRIIVCDLYKIFLDILAEKKVLDAVADMEERRGKEHLLAQLLKVASQDDFLRKMQYAPHEKGDVIFITGVGKVYPFMRSHKILNKMQEPFDKVPVIMFYPGLYDNSTLTLFNEFFDDNYYRAFNLLIEERN